MSDSSDQIIDPPIGPYGPIEDIRAWVRDLEQREQTENVKIALAQARGWLKLREAEADGDE